MSNTSEKETTYHMMTAGTPKWHAICCSSWFSEVRFPSLQSTGAQRPHRWCLSDTILQFKTHNTVLHWNISLCSINVHKPGLQKFPTFILKFFITLTIIKIPIRHKPVIDYIIIMPQ